MAGEDSAALRTTTALAACAILATVCAPAVLALRVLRRRSVGSVPFVPFVSLLLLSHAWVLYGFMSRHYFPLGALFALGDALAAIYLAVYWRFATDDGRSSLRRVLGLSTLFLALLTLYAVLGGLGLTRQSREGVATTLGCVTDAVIVALNGVPARNARRMLRRRSRGAVELPLALSALGANLVFIAYASVARNWFILIPNVVAAAIGATTVALYVRFAPSTRPQPADAALDAVCVLVADDDKLAAGKAVAVADGAPSPPYEALRSPLRPLQQQ